MRIPLSSPEITEADIEAVVSVLKTPRLSIGPKIVEFERAIADLSGHVAHGIAVNSGTTALHLCLRALGVGEGDEVILPSFTFIAAGNAILYERARPVFVDIEPCTLNLDPDKLERSITPKTRAILAVHTFGVPADMGPIMHIAGKYGVPVIEDACEAIGARYRGQSVGGIGHFGVFGFYPNKPITTGEGGMVVTRDSRMADIMRALRNQGRREQDGWLDHALLGYNYRISELNCALGLEQVKRIEDILDRRAAIARQYWEELQLIPGVTPPPLEIPEGRVCWFVYVVRLDNPDAILETLQGQGIGCARYFAPLHRQPLFAPFANPRDDLKVTEQAASQTLALPFFNQLTRQQIHEVCCALGSAIRSIT